MHKYSWKWQTISSVLKLFVTNHMLNDNFSEGLDIWTYWGCREWVLDLLTRSVRNGWPQDILSCYVPYNFPKADAERVEELRVFMIQIKPQREYLLNQLSKCLSGRICNQILQTIAGPVASSGKSTLFHLISHAFDADYYCNMPATYLTQKCAQANISRCQGSHSLRLHSSLKIGINTPQRLLWNHGFWGWANNPRWTHVNLSIPCLLASPKILEQQWDGLQSSLKIGRSLKIRLSTQSCVKVGLLGGADRTSSTQARLPRPCFLDQPQLYFQKWGCFQVSLEMCIWSLSSPQVWKSGAFGVGLTELVAHKLVFLDHVSFGVPNCTFWRPVRC